MTTGKTITLTRQTFVGKVISLLFNTPSTSVIVFLSRSKRLLISWQQSPSAVIFEPRKIKSDTISSIKIYIKMSVMDCIMDPQNSYIETLTTNVTKLK